MGSEQVNKGKDGTWPTLGKVWDYRDCNLSHVLIEQQVGSYSIVSLSFFFLCKMKVKIGLIYTRVL